MMKKINSLIKFVIALSIVLFVTYYIGGVMFDGFSKSTLQNAEARSAEIINAYGIILPGNTKVKELNGYHFMGKHYCVAKIEYTDIDNIKTLNQNNTKTINIKSHNEEDYVIIDSYSQLKKYALYENLRFNPQGQSVSLFYDQDCIYLSVDLQSPFGVELLYLFQSS